MKQLKNICIKFKIMTYLFYIFLALLLTIFNIFSAIKGSNLLFFATAGLTYIFSEYLIYKQHDKGFWLNLSFFILKISFFAVFLFWAGAVEVLLVATALFFLIYLFKYFFTKSIVSFGPYIISFLIVWAFYIFYITDFSLTYDYIMLLMFMVAPTTVVNFFFIHFSSIVLILYIPKFLFFILNKILLFYENKNLKSTV